jgi:hypothetical protein
MRIANLAGRATIVTDDGLIDLAVSSQGAFSASVDKCLSQLGLIRAWFASAGPRVTEATTPRELLGDTPDSAPWSPVPSRSSPSG